MYLHISIKQTVDNKKQAHVKQFFNSNAKIVPKLSISLIVLAKTIYQDGSSHINYNHPLGLFQKFRKW